MAARSAAHQAHHWMIDTLPKNDFYHAKCKQCGAEKDFPQEEPRFRFRISRNSSPSSAIEPPHPAAPGNP
ncbi:MAG: hypothetical protein A2Y91_03995 [Chloroflexi bacterium RBG_13_54_8]|nr:MAG: hypothetical protein A2Y91_03995 [Chloroflexi bacterium RBG_13_54_8]